MRRSTLTEREQQVVQLVAQGLTDKEIGRALTCSARTVGVHLRNIYGALGAMNRAHAVYLFYIENAETYTK